MFAEYGKGERLEGGRFTLKWRVYGSSITLVKPGPNATNIRALIETPEDDHEVEIGASVRRDGFEISLEEPSIAAVNMAIAIARGEIR